MKEIEGQDILLVRRAIQSVQDKYITPDMVAELTGKHVNTIRYHIRQGYLPTTVRNMESEVAMYVIDKEDLVRYFKRYYLLDGDKLIFNRNR